jgi:hypothetical protein
MEQKRSMTVGFGGILLCQWLGPGLLVWSCSLLHQSAYSPMVAGPQLFTALHAPLTNWFLSACWHHCGSLFQAGILVASDINLSGCGLSKEKIPGPLNRKRPRAIPALGRIGLRHFPVRCYCQASVLPGLPALLPSVWSSLLSKSPRDGRKALSSWPQLSGTSGRRVTLAQQH